MAVESIGAVPQSTTALSNIGLGQEDFIKILMTQLSFQDPLKPLDNQEFIAQMAEFSGLELNRQQNEKADILLAMQSASQALGLIGRKVEVQTGTGTAIGDVTTVKFVGGSPSFVLSLDNGGSMDDVRLSQIILVR